MAQPEVQPLPAEVTAQNTPALLARYEALLADTPQLVIDCAPLVQFDSSALALLLALRRRALSSGKSLRLVNLSDNLRKLAGLYGIEGLIH